MAGWKLGPVGEDVPKCVMRCPAYQQLGFYCRKVVLYGD